MLLLKNHRPFLILILIFLGLTTLYAETVPPFEGPDEGEHFAYVMKLTRTGQFPNPEHDLDTPIRQAAAQAPLYYTTAALFTRLRNFGDWEIHYQTNPWAAYPSAVTGRDNRNHFMMQPRQHAMNHNQRQMSAALQWMRRIAPIYGVLALLGVYWSALAIWPNQKSWAVFTALAYGMNPLLIQTFALASNDVAVIAFGSLTLAAGLQLVNDWRNNRLLVLAGMVMGLAALSKASGLALWIIPPAGIFMGWWQTKQNGRALILRGFAVIAIASLLAGWWYIRGWILYDDPLGTAPHKAQPWAWQEPQSISQILHRTPILVISFWANFGPGEVRPGKWGYVVPLTILGLGLIGWLYTRPTRHTLLLLLTVAVGLAALFQWMSMFDLITGRLAYPYYNAFILLIGMGLYHFRSWRHWFAGALGGMALVMVPAVIIHAFGPPPLRNDVPEHLEGLVIDFGGPRFLGYTVDSNIIHVGDYRHFEFCWQAPSSDEKIPVPYPFSISVTTLDTQLVGKRESFTGMGTYSLWQPNKIFCDDFTLHIEKNVEAGEVYPLQLSMFGLPDGIPIEATVGESKQRSVIIGHLWAPAPPIDPTLLQSAPFRFEGVALAHYDMRIVENTLNLNLTWGTYSAPRQPYKLFVHILDAQGQKVAQIDPVPGGDRYPIWAWGAGEKIKDSITLPILDLPKGSYQVVIGIYDPDTFQRLPVRDTNGNLMGDSALLGTVTIE
ncbi:MAG: hypothetical protein HY862_18365 [Chloroflexi bacterium]|nr:hypothetical protein [Chloroflexota bacterium]